MNDIQQYVPVTPKKRYRKGVRLEINAYAMAVLCLIFVCIYMTVFKQHLHPYMQFPALLLVVGIGAGILIPSSANKGKKLYDQFLILIFYEIRMMVERVLRYVSV